MWPHSHFVRFLKKCGLDEKLTLLLCEKGNSQQYREMPQVSVLNIVLSGGYD